MTKTKLPQQLTPLVGRDQSLLLDIAFLGLQWAHDLKQEVNTYPSYLIHALARDFNEETAKELADNWREVAAWLAKLNELSWRATHQGLSLDHSSAIVRLHERFA
jgi:hypothetical protein